jgi:Tn3 transposase DDE domain
MAIHSQLISCSASEVAAMIDGAMRHGTTLDVEGNYTDTHGQSQIAFGITRLLGFELLPRIKGINHAKLYQADPGDRSLYPGLVPALTRPIRWERIAEQYDQMIKYATAIRTRTAQTEAILRRFMVHAGQRDPPDLPGDDRARPGAEDDLHLPVSTRAGAPARDPGRAQRRRVLAPRHPGRLLRQRRGTYPPTAATSRNSRSSACVCSKPRWCTSTRS